MTTFVRDVLVQPLPAYAAVRDVFEASYTLIDGKRVNRFTKVRIDYQAHLALERYVREHLEQIESTWFDVRSPEGKTAKDLRDQLTRLVARKWLGCP